MPLTLSKPGSHLATHALAPEAPVTTLALSTQTRQQYTTRRQCSWIAAEQYPEIGEVLQGRAVAMTSHTQQIQRWLAVNDAEYGTWTKLWAALYRHNPNWFNRYWVIRRAPHYPNLPAGVQAFYVDSLRTHLGSFQNDQIGHQVHTALLQAIAEAPDVRIFWLEPMWLEGQPLSRRNLLAWQRQQQDRFQAHHERFAASIRQRIKDEAATEARAREARRRRIAWDEARSRLTWQLQLLVDTAMGRVNPARLDPLLVFKQGGVIRKIAHW